MNRVIEKILWYVSCAFFPNRCCVCGKVIEPDELFCDYCRITVARVPDNILRLWSRCKNLRKIPTMKLHFDGYIGPYYHEDGGKDIVYNFKLGKRIELADIISSDMAVVFRKFYNNIDFDFLCGVPMRKFKVLCSEFDQVAVLCEELEKKLNIPYNPIIEQIKTKKPQHTLSAKERFKNVKGIYAIEPKCDIRGKTILLIDDISTTGASLNECAKILKKNGARKVYCLMATIT